MIKKLLQLLEAEDTDTFKLELLEAIGCLVLCIHWIRGTFNWMYHKGLMEFPTEEDKKNYERLFGNIALYESIIWEIAPSRAMLPILREYRKGEELPEGFEVLSAKDSHGRIPYTTQPHTLEDIQRLLDRLGKTRMERNEDVDMSNFTSDDFEDLLRRLGDVQVYKKKHGE